MKQQLYAIQDTRTGAHWGPSIWKNEGEATANFYRLVNDPLKRSPVSEFPEDYDLWHLGAYDTDTAKCDLLDTKVHVAKGADLKNRS